MGFLGPSALALAALAIPIIIFYMLKLRRQPARVSSLFLWQQVLQDRRANAPWQRLKRNLLLLLQLLALALLVMALARPYLTVQARVQGNVVLLVDASASMQATDVRPSRFEAAQAAALDVIDRLEPDDAVTLITVEETPRILASAATDHAALRNTLNRYRPGNGPADWTAALTLATAHAVSLPEATVVIVSDGALRAAEAEANNTPLHLPIPVQFIPIGESAANQGLVTLSLREGRTGPELFFRAFNAAAEPVRRRAEIYVDEQLFDARWLDLPAGDSSSLSLTNLPLEARQVRVTLAGEDILAADDTAWVVRSAAPAQVLVVGEGNLFLERALALIPGLTSQRAAPDQPLPETPFDLIIFDRTVPPAGDLPPGNLLFIAPPTSTSLFQVAGVMTQTQVTYLERNSPLLAYVKLDNVHLARAQAVQPPAWSQTLIEAEGGPLLLAGQTGQRRVALLTFDLFQSDLPLQVDFPILLINLTGWLLPEAALEQGQSLQSQQRFNLPAIPSASYFTVETPQGEQVTVPADQLTFGDTSELGVYRVLSQESDSTEPALVTEFAVNLLAETETDLQPKSVTFSGTAAAVAEETLTGRREWWWIPALLGLAILLAEWWIYWQGASR